MSLRLEIAQKDAETIKKIGILAQNIKNDPLKISVPSIDPFPPGTKLAWAMPHDLSLISTATHHSLICVARPSMIEYASVNKGGDIDIKRELQIQASLQIGCNYVWLIDGDMVYPSDILIRLFRLLEQGADLAGGLCYRGYPPYEPIAKNPKDPTQNMLPGVDFEFGDIIKPLATGAACLLVPRRVFESISRPWFKTIYNSSNPAKIERTEDIYFTQRATDAGFKLWIDTSIDVDHIREIGINREFYFLHQLIVRLNGTNGTGKGRIRNFLTKAADPKWIEEILDPILKESIDTKEITQKSEIIVSAIVSTYRSSKFMKGCLQDLVSQTLYEKGQVEIVVIDSGSDENEKETVEDFQKQYPNIKYFRTDNETVYAAWNRGINASSGKYITSANTDDRHRHDAFERMVDVLEKNQAIALIYADVIITEKENETFEKHTPVGSFNWYDWDRNVLLNRGCFIGPQPMWRRSIHDEYGYFDESMVTSGDYEFWLRISQTHDFHHIKEALGLYLRSPNGLEYRSQREQMSENRKILTEYCDAANDGKIIKRERKSN